MIGHIKIIKEFNGIEHQLYEARNTISDGVALALTSMLASTGSDYPNDYSIGYYQLGSNSLSGVIPARTVDRNFYELADAFPASAYGSSSVTAPVILNQLVPPNGNFTTFSNLVTTSASFIEIPLGQKRAILNKGINLRIKVDKDMANGQSINEIGIFIKNPFGSVTDEPILFAYKTFPSVTKTDEFSLIIDWKIVVKDESAAQQSSFSDFGVMDYEVVTIDMLSGVDSISNIGTGGEYSERFEVLVPSAYDPNGAPLVVYIHGSDQDLDYYRLNSTIGDFLNSRGWFCVAPFGKVTRNIQNSHIEGLYPHSKALTFTWPSRAGFEQLKAVGRYVCQRYPINKNKIYLMGFAEGAAAAMNYASWMMDLSTSAWRPAGVINHSGPLNTVFNWWYHAASALTVQTVTAAVSWPTPPNSVTTSAGLINTFCNSTSGDFEINSVSALPGIMKDDGIDGYYWPSVSAFSPENALYHMWENTTLNFNLNTSTLSKYDLSGCTIRNLTHVPIYSHWNTNDPSGPIYTLPNNLLSGLLVNSGLPFVYRLSPSATGEHVLSSIDFEDAFNFCDQYQLSTVYSASTTFCRSGEVWYFNINSYVYETGCFTNTLYGILNGTAAGIPTSGMLSGLGSFYWEVKPAENAYYHYGERYVKDDTQENYTFYPEKAGLVSNQNNPLFIYILSSTPDYPHGYPHNDLSRRVTLSGYYDPYALYYSAQTNAVGDALSFGTRYKCNKVGAFWRANGVAVAQESSATDELYLGTKFGKFEVIKEYDPNL